MSYIKRKNNNIYRNRLTYSIRTVKLTLEMSPE